MINTVEPMQLTKLPEKPLVSVLMANYNYGEYIGEAIQSLINQTYPHWELIVVDDGSTDDSVEQVTQFSKREPRIKLIQKENEGVATALNVAFDNAQGEILCLLDSDDIFFPEKLDLTVRSFLDCSDAGLSVHKVLPIGSRHNIISYPIPAEIRGGYIAAEILANGGDAPLPPASGISVRREVAREFFPVPCHLRKGVDSYIRFCAAMLAPVSAIDRPLAFYRIHQHNLTAASRYSKHKNESLIGDHERLFEAYREFLGKGGVKLDGFDIQNSRGYQSLLFAKAIYERRKRPLLTNEVHIGWRKYAWSLLFILPSKLAQLLFELWWSDNLVKEYINKAILLLSSDYFIYKKSLRQALRGLQTSFLSYS